MDASIVKRHFTDLTYPFSFGGAEKVYRYFRKNPSKLRSKVSRKSIEKALASVEAYSVLKHRKKPAHYNPYYIHTKRQLLNFDLIDMRGLKEHNDGVSYILLGIDTWTRKIWGRLLKRKTGAETSRQMDSILTDAGVVPGFTQIMTDFGKEFIASDTVRIFRKHGVAQIFPNKHASFIGA